MPVGGPATRGRRLVLSGPRPRPTGGKGRFRLGSGGEINDDGDVLVPMACVAPYMLVNTNDFDPIETPRVINEYTSSFSQDGLIRGVPSDAEAFSDPGYGEVLAHDSLQSPGQSAPGELRPRFRSLRPVLPPDVTTFVTVVAGEPDQQDGGSPTEGFMAQPAGSSVPRNAGKQGQHDPGERIARSPQVRVHRGGRKWSGQGIGR